MAKTSKIVKNDRRREIVARYAEQRAELKEIIRSPRSTAEEREAAAREPRRQPATRRQPESATATPWTAGRGLVSARSACRGYGCERWHTAVSCPA